MSDLWQAVTTLGTNFEHHFTSPKEYVTWSELLEWAKVHGAINDRITSITIGTVHIDSEARGVVTLIGWAENEHGKPYTVGPGHEPAMWQITNQILRRLP